MLYLSGFPEAVTFDLGSEGCPGLLVSWGVGVLECFLTLCLIIWIAGEGSTLFLLFCAFFGFLRSWVDLLGREGLY